MGCDDICQAKKKAADAQKQADEATAKGEKMKADANGKAGSYTATVLDPNNMITVGKVLKIDKIQGALDYSQLFGALSKAQANSLIMANAVAKTLILPLQGFIVAWKVVQIAEMVVQIAQPILKIAAMVMDVVMFNFASIAQLVGEIIVLLGRLALMFTPMLIELLKNILFNIPLYWGTMDIKIVWKAQALVASQSKTMSKKFSIAARKLNVSNSIKKANARNDKIIAMGGTPAQKLDTSIFHQPTKPSKDAVKENLANLISMCKDDITETATNEILNNVPIDLTDIMSDISDDEKEKAGKFLGELIDATKKIEILQSGALLDNTFAVSEEILDALADKILEADDMETAFWENARIQIEALKEASSTIRDEIEATEEVAGLILANQTQLVETMTDGIKNISTILIPSTNIIPIENLENSIIDAIKEIDFINNPNAPIIINPVITSAYSKNTCDVLSYFKTELYSTIKKSIYNGRVDVRTSDIPSNMEPENVRSTIDQVLDVIKSKLMESVDQILISETIICQACKPCSQLNNELDSSIQTKINQIKTAIANKINLAISQLPQPVTEAQKQAIANSIISEEVIQLNLVYELQKTLSLEQNALVNNVKKLMKVT